MTDATIGENIRKVRELKGFSQDYMASQLSISQKAYSNIENGKRKIDKDLVEQLAGILDVAPLSLVTFDEKILFSNCNQPGLFTTQHMHWMADKERDSYEKRLEEQQSLYEKRITELKEEITFLRSLIKKDS